MRIALLTREYPPEIYGGAGVHVEYLGRELAELVDLKVYCFGKPRGAPEVAGAFDWWDALAGNAPHQAALRTLATNLQMAGALEGAELCHSHTWYANFAGHLGQMMYGIPHVMTSHSLEPLRPWKEEQLGGGYRVSRYIERASALGCDRIIAVSSEMRSDILRAYPEVSPEKVRVIYNGIDTDEYSPGPHTGALGKHGVDASRPTVMFVGRITRQKGVVHLLEAAAHFAPEVQLVLCAGAADTEDLEREVSAHVQELMQSRSGIFWIRHMLPREEVIAMLREVTVFVCPSIYEPFGIVNVEAMGCGVAVVASKVGGIKEVVADGETGLLVDYEGDAQGNPVDRARFARDFAERVNRVATDHQGAVRMGEAGRARAVDKFGWKRVAAQTVDLYREILET